MSLSKTIIKDMGYAKINKVHAQERMMKKKRKEKMHTQRRYATCPQAMSKKERKRKYSPYQKNIQGREIIKRSFTTIHQKYPHTCTSWSRFITCFSFGSGLWLNKIWEAGLPSYPPYLQLHQQEAFRSRMEKKGT